MPFGSPTSALLHMPSPFNLMVAALKWVTVYLNGEAGKVPCEL